MNIKKKISRFYYILLISLITPSNLVFAQTFTGGIDNPSTGGIDNSSGGSSSLENPLSFKTVDEFLIAFLGVVIQVGAPLVVLAIVYSGFLFVRAQGKPEELEKAKSTFFWTIVGAVLILGALAVQTLLKGTIANIRA